MRTVSKSIVSLDVGGTLIQPWPSVGHVYAEVGERFGLKREPDELTSGFIAGWKERSGFNYQKHEWQSLVERAFGVNELPEGMFDALYERFEAADVWQVFPDVIPFLEMCQAKGIRLVAVSNWDERLVLLMNTLGLADYFEAIVVSCEVDAPKPSPVIFAEACRRMNCEAEQVVHIGDSQREDVEGARAFGMKAAFIDRRQGQTMEKVWDSVD